MLVNYARERNNRTKRFFDWLSERNLLNVEEIEIDASAYDSSGDPTSARIRFGSGLMPKPMFDKRIYRGEMYDYREQKSYILVHECLHKLFTLVRTNKNHPALSELSELFELAKGIRLEDPTHGLSANGSDRYYLRKSSQSIQAMEDCVELATLWVFKPGLVDQYFDDLVDDRLIKMRQDHGLVNLDPKTSIKVKSLLNGWMAKTLNIEISS